MNDKIAKPLSLSEFKKQRKPLRNVNKIIEEKKTATALDRFTVLFLTNAFASKGTAMPCPQGWTSIGYESSAAAEYTYQVCAR